MCLSVSLRAFGVLAHACLTFTQYICRHVLGCWRSRNPPTPWLLNPIIFAIEKEGLVLAKGKLQSHFHTPNTPTHTYSHRHIHTYTFTCTPTHTHAHPPSHTPTHIHISWNTSVHDATDCLRPSHWCMQWHSPVEQKGAWAGTPHPPQHLTHP